VADRSANLMDVIYGIAVQCTKWPRLVRCNGFIYGSDSICNTGVPVGV